MLIVGIFSLLSIEHIYAEKKEVCLEDAKTTHCPDIIWWKDPEPPTPFDVAEHYLQGVDWKLNNHQTAWIKIFIIQENESGVVLALQTLIDEGNDIEDFDITHTITLITACREKNRVSRIKWTLGSNTGLLNGCDNIVTEIEVPRSIKTVLEPLPDSVFLFTK